ncbi:MAG: S53 family peptidase [Thermaerobacter sp.]|nr:S53 family peptidase [Thermaerobacter sp.]
MPLAFIAGHAPRTDGVPLSGDRRLQLALVLRHSGPNLAGGVLAGLFRHLQSSGLMPEAPDTSAGVVFAAGNASAIERAFSLQLRADATGSYAPDREPSLPRSLAAEVCAVIGLTNKPRARRAAHRFAAESQPFQGFRPDEIAQAYAFDQLPAGTGRAVLLEFGSGYRQSDLDLFCMEMGLPRLQPTVRRIDRGVVDPGLQPVDLEATLDLEWLWAAARGGEVFFLEAPPGSNDAAFSVYLVDALRSALALRPDVVSVSYGDGELLFPPAELQAIDLLVARLQSAGADTFIASGDQGAYGLHEPGQPAIAQVDAPACVPHAIAVGGTHLAVATDGSIKETGWTDIAQNGAGGGGFSQVFAAPQDQQAFLPPGSQGRGVPDLAMNADPLSGYQVVFEAQVTVVGGTSVAAPVAAGAALRLRAQVGKLSLSSAVYSLPKTVFRDIVEGNNSYAGVQGYECGPGWDPVTGRGAPLFAEIAAAIR